MNISIGGSTYIYIYTYFLLYAYACIRIPIPTPFVFGSLFIRRTNADSDSSEALCWLAGQQAAPDLVCPFEG